MTLADGGVMLEAALGKTNQLVLQVGNFCNAAAAEEFLFNILACKLTLTEV